MYEFTITTVRDTALTVRCATEDGALRERWWISRQKRMQVEAAVFTGYDAAGAKLWFAATDVRDIGEVRRRTQLADAG